ncbi:MAG: NUDIX domain-containing protein [Maricaulaceae bacterium]
MSTGAQRLYAVAKPLVRVWARASRGMTLGVRVAVFDRDGQVALVRHTYMPGWHLPGGGVERGETVLEAAEREVREEAGAALTSPLTLVGVYANFRTFKGDHVAFFTATGTAVAEPRDDGEIAEAGWFAPTDLPGDVTAATRARLDEVASGVRAPAHWSG